MTSWLRSTFRKLPHKYVIYDYVQRGIVYSVIYVLSITTIRYGIELRHHFKVRKPIIEEKKRALKEYEFERLQAEREFELSKAASLQAEADNIKP
ncbi:hypothetical protein DPMN_079457 [Dreissena polymorpha]|uniref:Uncharacterized protein n=1 Tax=Dreissena polymorpha TaxID=45954 RepID=A0A9D4BT02_DREPO|nr:hypothetical protein DPMN_079457 [Dreissena polymorpha]